ncbi:hypothetical protein PGTUg99_037582 [Puccinia graminis f. sp. tritici]|uniref:DUF6589 domain-containing protein n=1 Tax=Puccinia graminis f. sp. tritici TaxID=56615 RepID=A0A5B0SMV7_PUCGR|nr:hypothetical protein PGTUg99_037582 [Puccinia graminis f. sp. tritici]
MIPFSQAEFLAEPVTGPTAAPAGSMTETLAGSARKPIRTEESKLKAVADLLAELDYTPKTYMASFLTHENEKSTFARRFWGTDTGWDSTRSLLKTIRDLVCKKPAGQEYWADFILAEAQEIVVSQKPPSGIYPKGGYHSTKDISEKLFSSTSKENRDRELVEEHMPFLFNLIYHKLKTNPICSKDADVNDSDDNEQIPAEDFEDYHGDESAVAFDRSASFDPRQRAYTTAKTACSMVAFVLNRRNNGHQLANSLTFLACGVTDRVNSFLHYIGLTSSRKTAHRALNQLGYRAKELISSKMLESLSENLAPFLCIDNLDFEQKIHSQSLGKSNRMFHGTWGYIHHPSQKLIDSVPPADITNESYQQAMSNLPSFQVIPSMLLPTVKEEEDWEAVLKSQIAQVILEYLVAPLETKNSIKKEPPIADQISHDLPNLTMLKLMIASDNSAQGVGEVFESIVDQSKINMNEFSSRLQIIDGDLGTCTNVSTLRSQRIPSKHKEESLGNILTILGGAHTMWNISQAIFKKHFGDQKDSRDSGAWRFLESMAIPTKKMLDKKDYTLMIKNIEKIHKAALVYCVKVVMGTKKEPVTEPLKILPCAHIQEIIDKTYKRFFTPEARDAASELSSPKLSNLLLRLTDFATIVEGNLAMKAGDTGRVMNIWKRWAVIAQGVKKLTQYSIQLPRMIILLNEILPPGMGKLIQHSMLIAPSGRPNHFVAKDSHLKSQNYWLKFFFNNSGRGTDIDRLKDVYSLNVPLVCTPIHLN